MAEKKLYGTVLIKADQILDFLYDTPTPQSLSRISENTGITKSTISKILETLEHIGYVSRNNQNKTYSIGQKIIKYSSKKQELYQFDDSVLRKIDDLYEAFDETVHLGVYQADQIVTTKKIQSSKSVICISSDVGDKKELYSSAMGKAVLAELDDESLFNYINEKNFVAKTDKTIAEAQKLLSEVETIRSQGFSIDDEENEEGVFCVGTSLVRERKNQPKEILGAFSMSLPVYRATEDKVEEIVASLMSVKQSIQKTLV
ncbi:IclR family transcriptional regulator [Fundicoccus sp. Sow4_H7]|uniref:IclR family transcriptional regulator n=1 Tax=Fundicoccus sp. Sow4_H7 TaxID=3438784 RepID=UPI003F900E6D